MPPLDYETIKAMTLRRGEFVRGLVSRASTMPFMTERDKTDADEASNSIEAGERVLFEALDLLRGSDPEIASKIAWAVDVLTGGVLIAASRSTLPDSALNAAAYRQAEEARSARRNSPQERDLRKAIQKILAGRDPATRGMTGKILDGVNAMLVEAGHEKVLRDVVARRLKEMRS